MKKIGLLIVLLLIISMNAETITAQWFSQVSGTPRHLLGMDVLDSNIVYCSGELGANVKTSNGGINWFNITPPLIDNYNNCSFINLDTGLFVGPPGRMIRTTNGGISWTVIFNPVSGLGDVQFVNKNWVYACGGGVIRSTDGGLNWSLLGNYPSILQSLYFTDSLTGTVVGTNGFIITTTNGGLNWVQRYMNLPVQFADSSLYCIQYINSLTGYAGGNNGIIVKTTNGGANWNYIPSGTLFFATGIYFTDENNGTFTSTFGVVYHTTNGGINWNQQPTGVISPLMDVEFINENTGWICGFNGTILKTTNGGTTWIQPVSTEIPDNFKLYQNYPNPFNPSTIINYELRITNDVKLKVYDVLGNELMTLVNEKQNAGTYSVVFDGSGFPSGIYFYRLEADGYVYSKRMMLVK